MASMFKSVTGLVSRTVAQAEGTVAAVANSAGMNSGWNKLGFHQVRALASSPTK